MDSMDFGKKMIYGKNKAESSTGFILPDMVFHAANSNEFQPGWNGGAHHTNDSI